MAPVPDDGHPYQLVAAALADQIRRGDLATNDRLPSLRKLAKQHDVTVATVQRAVQQLVSENLVRSVPNLGYYVLSLDGAAPPPLTIDELGRQMTELRAEVEILGNRVLMLEAEAAGGR